MRNGLPEAISLPDSHASSSNAGEHGLNQNSPKDSLEIILKSGPPVIPSAIPLPGVRRKKRKSGSAYDQTLENAGKVLEHIREGNVRKHSRHQRTSIVCYDYSNSVRSEPKTIQKAKDIASLAYTGPNIQQRLLIVEDLSKPTINALGGTFGINPEFFEEHLLNSGYAGAEYDMLPARMWATASLKKSYVSMRWIRPVYRVPMYSSNRSMKDLAKISISGKENPVETVGDTGKVPPKMQGHIEHFTRHGVVTTRVSTNIFRSEWRLWTDPTKASSTKRECGLEERVSVWKGQLTARDCKIVIMLLDPLPKVEEEHPATATKTYDWGLSEGDEDLNISEADTDSAEKGIAHILYGTRSPFARDGPLPMRWVRTIKRRMDRGPVRSMQWKNNLKQNERLSSIKIIIEHIAPRHEVTVDLDHVFQTQESAAYFGKNLQSSTSTSDGVCGALERHAGSVGLGGPLFQIIRQDTFTLLRQLGHVLDEVELGVLDVTKMEDRLSSWLQLIGRAQRELPELEASIKPFMAWLHLNAIEDSPAGESQVLQDICDLSEHIKQMCDRLQRTSALLNSNMGLLGSRRSIDEVQAVNRLTELAFVFIPLSFTTSVFGMQVEPFADPVPLRSFFILAVGMVTFAYLMRMTMRSQWVAYLKMVVKYDIRRYAENHGLPIPTRSVPVLLTVRWIGSWFDLSGIKRTWTRAMRPMRRLWVRIWDVSGFLILSVLLNGSISGIPIAVLWTRDLDPSTQGAVTIAIVIMVIASVGIPFWHWCDPDFRNAFPKFLSDRVHRCPSWVMKPLILLILPVIFMIVSLALIWTRPLTTGIKAALTVGILMFGIIFIAPVILRRIFYRLSFV
ncbi:Mg2+ transporter protein CorA-like/Zinc transport protein ZntB [Penicillium paradoxum]|uniref:Mg2+ transporter protein CorA-like/Zinc transport protein ZntB n=1 Tax=Penicillium paradoxum TaxID=176176 RepID=UPI002548E866|nr:Mg2+ transporter protein CorA-like/Zinc transport protein ZntB [Penicillium paradoxum]KAJ5788393.1 Mg2+ transporter protein CorA-like/Zinc transport protein ZntB [Penicillium paradoxum]